MSISRDISHNKNNKLRNFLICLGVAFLALAALICVIQVMDTTLGKNGLSQRDTADINAGLREVIRDPSSLKTGGMIAGPEKNSVWVCGWMNAHNGFGGYAQKAPFIGLLHRDTRTFIVGTVGDSSGKREFTLQSCASRGLTLTQ